MNNSVEFIKNRIEDGQTHNMPSDGWDDVTVLNPIEHYKRMPIFSKVVKVEDNEVCVFVECGKDRVKILVKYDPNSEFDYFTTKSITHDGTAIFILEAIDELLFKPFNFGTMPIDIGINGENYSNYDYEYIIGDIVIHKDCGMKDINGHTMLGETNTIVLPIKFKKIPK